MFIERSTGRIRFARRTFLLAGLLPCAAFVAWAVHLHSVGHREALRLEWQGRLGLPLEVESVRHPRPGVVRAFGCRLAVPGGGVIAVPAVEIESSTTEVRLRIERLVCDAAAARLLGGLARCWLAEEARYPRDCIVEIGGFSWESLPTVPASALRVECVTRDGTRAVRAVLGAGADGRHDELRAVRSAADGDVQERLEVDGECTAPVPVAIAAAVLGIDASVAEGAVAVGRVHAVRDDGAWSGTATGRIDALDLACCTARLQARAVGEATAVIRRLAWSKGRIRDAEVECVVGRGRVEQRLLDGLVSMVGCRPGAAHRTLSGAAERTFDAAGCVLRIDARGIEVLSGANLGGGLAIADGMALVEPPGGVIPAERLAWVLTPPGAVSVPSAGPGAWLLDVVPRPEQAVRPGPRGGF